MAKRLQEIPTENNINIDSRVINKAYRKYLSKVHNYEVYFGGNGSGKSTFIAQKLAYQMTVFPGRNLVCLRAQKTDCLQSCWGEIVNALGKFKLKRYWNIKRSTHEMINRVNGNHIIFEGLDEIEDIKSIKFEQEMEETEGDNNLTDIWYEEVNAEKDKENVEELDGRLRDPYIKCRLILSFNPVSRSHWLYEYVTRDLKMEGVDSLIVHTTYKDNEFLPKSQGEKLERYKYTNPYRYQVYCLGQWGTMGETVFNSNLINDRLKRIQEYQQSDPPQRGYFIYDKDNTSNLPVVDSYKFAFSGSGYITIYEEAKPRHPYVFALDTAGEGSDYFAGHMCDNSTGEQVAVFHTNGNPTEAVWQAYGLCVMYNHALFCPESNFDSWAIKAFQLMSYPSIYVRQAPADSRTKRRQKKYGFQTTAQNRQTILSECVQWVEDNIALINDPTTLNELLTFTRQEKKMKGIFWGAEPGAHDDLVMALAILLQARTQQSMELVVDKYKIEGEWSSVELRLAVESGRVDPLVAREYIETHGCFDYKDEEVYSKQKGVSVYDR